MQQHVNTVCSYRLRTNYLITHTGGVDNQQVDHLMGSPDAPGIDGVVYGALGINGRWIMRALAKESRSRSLWSTAITGDQQQPA